MSYSSREAGRYYGIDAWGNGYFGINDKGHLTVHPLRDARGVDVYGLLPHLTKRKLRCPVLLRFPQILKSRLEELFGAFNSAIREFHYPGAYRGVFPIKVNQNADVVAALVKAGRKRGFGLEAGSKAELAVALTHRLDDKAIVVCNGYKDADYVRLALRATQLGRKVILIVEKPHEVELIARVAKQLKVKPWLGARIRLHSRSSGKWTESSGSGSKFGLTTQELLDAVSRFDEHGLLPGFCLVHFHVGSQITEIRSIKAAVKEGARVYAKLRATGCPVEYLDVGGGLGVDYDGSKTSYEASMNYSVREYANDVVYGVQEICEAEDVPPPTLVSESGRALTAYHALLISEVGGQNRDPDRDLVDLPADAHDSLRELYEIRDEMTRKNHREFFHDAQARYDELHAQFDLGYLSLRDRALAERLMAGVRRQALEYAKDERFMPDEFQRLERRLISKYIANFSVFQSLPDHWALDQLFPVLPIHRLDERPTVQATLCDVTCDSFGEIDRFVDISDRRTSLALHELEPGKPYYFAITLLGAYQDVLGDYHNLFGRVDEAHVQLDKNGKARIVKAVRGDEAHEVLELFGYDPDAMIERVQEQIEERVAAGKLGAKAAERVRKEYERSLDGYTYLDFG
ncbi:MAG: biosynthetic arginine decarboxylase [Planctomycetota bacterium]|nr:biosynthetic arginine decarboxylase [Planctomycetota bacterium]